MKKPSVKRIFISCLTVLLLGSGNAYAIIWQADKTAYRSIHAGNGSQFVSDDFALRHLLDQVPNEISGQSLKIDLPMPDGSLAAYRIYESSIMQPGLTAKFPDIKSYVVQGIDHPGSSGRVDISPKGFRGMIYTPYGRVYIDPEQAGSTQYLSRTNKGQSQPDGFQCSAYDLEENNQTASRNFSTQSTSNRISGSLTTYRLAVSATPEYVTAVGGGLIATMAEINTVINRVNFIYERDLGIKLFLVSDNEKLIDLDGSAGFSNEDGLALLNQNQAWIDSTIGSGSYDIGHIFSTGGGGVAQLQSVCSSSKARGVTGLPDPVALKSDIFYIDFVSHEIGHQFGGNHTFNGSTDSCGGANRNAATAYEPGSGATIMAYAGICGEENLQSQSDATFHAGTIAEINAFVTNPSTGGSCASFQTVTNNDPILLDAGADKTIPVSTAFRLEVSAVDNDGDSLSYQWDQMDTGSVTTATTFGDDLINNALFRTYSPVDTTSRDFPSLGTQLDGLADLSESLPCTNRDMNFRVTVRDGQSGQAIDDVKLTVDSTSGPFKISSHNNGETIFASSAAVNLSWDVANTDQAPVSCPNVDIDLLTFSDNDSSYAVNSLLSATENDGNALVTIPDMFSNRARFRVACSNNVFYDISDNHLTIQDSGAGVNFPTTGEFAFVNVDGLVFAPKDQGCTAISGGNISSGGGGGAPASWWLLLLSGTLPARRLVKAYTQS